MIETIILAGGKGTRLQEIVTDIPKPMAPVNGKPFLFYLLSWLHKYPVDKIIFSAGYKHKSIRDHFGDFFGDILLEYVIEDKPLGTGGAIIKAMKSTRMADILIINGDTWFPVDLDDFYSKHIRYKHIFSVALKRMQKFSRYGTVECDGNTITRFNEKKQCDEGLINGGIYLVNRSFFEEKKYPEVFSLEKDVLVKAAGTSVLRGVVYNDPFIDIGVPEDYLRASSVITIV
jgi:D-glycero-alpha-D-manno-heptose 1-phosphate guanylyltransferase